MRLYLEEIAIKANREYRPPEGVAYVPRVGVTIGINEGASSDGTPLYRCALRVQAEPITVEQTLPYEVDAHVIGLFAFVHQAVIDREPMQRMVAVNGTTMLYSFARDAIMHCTALAEHGPFVLPAINVMSIQALVDPPEPLAQIDPVASEAEEAVQPPRRSTRRKRKSGD